MRTPTRLPWLTLALSALSCAAPRPSAIPTADIDLVVIKTVRIPTNEPWYSRFAEHSWIDMHAAGETDWTRVEANLDPEVRQIPAAEAHEANRWGRDVELLSIVEGPTAAAFLPLIRSRAAEVAKGFVYRAYPGPNSNTYIVRILHGVPGLDAELEHNSVGKDYTASVSAGLTPSADGFHFDTMPLGLSLGYLSGVELHILGLTAGLSFWPPAIKLPILPRIGFAPGSTRVP